MLFTRFIFFFLFTSAIAGVVWLTSTKQVMADTAIAPDVNISQNLGNYMGYGIGIHASDASYPKAFDGLEPEFVRMEFGPRWDNLAEKLPTGKSVEDYFQYLERNYNGDSSERSIGAKYTHDFLRERGIKIIKIHFELPYHWRAEDGSNRFKSKHIQDLARFHTAHLKYLQKIGVSVDYMELANEPDGVWNGHIPPADYARLVQLCDQLFEKHGFGGVKIFGPGLTFINLHNTPAPYFEALKEIGPKHLDGWSTHIWDEAEFTSSRPEYTYGIWKPFRNLINKVDPDKTKPLFITEYASDITKFGEKEWISPRDQIESTVVDTWHNAVRVVANSITNLNRGANALVLYRLTDTHWHKTGWGMVTPLTKPDFKPKPVYHAVAHALKSLPLESKVLSPLWYTHDEPITLSILNEEKKNMLHIIAANSTENTQTKKLTINADYTVKDISSMIESGITQATNVSVDNRVLTLEMPPLSIARIKLQQ